MAWYSRIVGPNGTVLDYVLTYDYRFYLLDNIRMASIPETEAFCWACHQFVPSERIRTPAQCAAEIRWLKSRDGEERRIAEFIHGDLEQVVDRCRRDIQFWRSRTSPPRCLMCGSTNIVQREADENGHETKRLPHPGYFPEGLRVEVEGRASTGSFFRLFTTEGEELRMPAEELVDTVNRCHGAPICAILKNGQPYYGPTFSKAT